MQCSRPTLMPSTPWRRSTWRTAPSMNMTAGWPEDTYTHTAVQHAMSAAAQRCRRVITHVHLTSHTLHAQGL